MDDNPYNDAHMSFEAFFRFCSAFELFPLASRHVIQTIYKNVEQTQAMFTPAQFGWVKSEAAEKHNENERAVTLDWAKTPFSEMTPVMKEALRVLSTFVEFADNRLLRSRDLFRAMDSDGSGLIDSVKLEHALTILATAHPRASKMLKSDDEPSPNIGAQPPNMKGVLRLFNGEDPDDASIEDPTITLEQLDLVIQDFRMIGTGDGQFMFKNVGRLSLF